MLAVWIVIAVVVLVVVAFAVGYNRLVRLRNEVDTGWANIDVQLKRRFDLITRLVPIVEAVSAHESGVQRAVAAMRGQLMATAPGAAGPDVRAAMPVLTLVSEAYPDLKAQTNFAALSNSLRDCEDRIALARTYFNDIATHWNIRLDRFPDLILAKLTRLQRQALMPELEPPSSPDAPVVSLAR